MCASSVKNELVGPNVNCWIDLIYSLSLSTSNMLLWCDSANLKSFNKLMQGSTDRAYLVYSAVEIPIPRPRPRPRPRPSASASLYCILV